MILPADCDLIPQRLYTLGSLRKPGVKDSAVEGLKLKDTLQLLLHSDQSFLGLFELVWLIVLEHMQGRIEDPSIFRVDGYQLFP